MNLEDYEKLKKLDAFSRHKKFINDYFSQIKKQQKKNNSSINNNNSNSSSNNKNNNKYINYKSDYEILKENHQFLREDENHSENENELTWEEKLAKKYYDRLFKEYAIIDLSHYKSGEIGLRWRIESEVVSGRGQFTCANKKCTTLSTTKKDELKSFEVPFSYKEQNQDKLALVKVVLCPLCSKLLNYSNIKKKKKELKQFLKNNKQSISNGFKDKKKRKYKEESNNSGSDNEESNSGGENLSDIEEYEESNQNVSKKLKTDSGGDNDQDIFSDMFI